MSSYALPMPPATVPSGPLLTMSSGLRWFDTSMGGGARSGHVNAVLGANESLLTTLLTQFAVDAAMRASDPNAAVVCLNWQWPIIDYQRRAAANAATIDWRSLWMNSWKDGLSQSDNLRPYEQEMFRSELANGQRPPGERERLAQALAWLEPRLIFVDVRDEHIEPSLTDASEILDAICVRVRSAAAACGKYAVVLLLDNLFACILHYLSRVSFCQRPPLDQLLTNCGKEMANRLAIPLSCPVWVSHPITKAALDPPKVIPRFKQAHYAPRLCWAFDHVFCVGNVDHGTKCLRAAYARGVSPGTNRGTCILKLETRFCRLDDVSNAYRVRGEQIDPIRTAR